MAMLTPQEALDRLQQAAGRALTPEEINQAKGMLPAGWEQGIDDQALAPLIDKAASLNTSRQWTNSTGVYDGGTTGPTRGGTVDNNGTYGRANEGAGNAGGAAGPAQSAFPQFNPPVYQGPGQYQPGVYSNPIYQNTGPFIAPAPFSYQPFQQATLDEAQNEPGYAFARDQGRKELETSAAAKGLTRTGGTLKDLFSWGDQFATQNYTNVNNRKFQTWSANQNNAANAYAMNYGVSKDTFSLNDTQNQNTFDRNALGGLTAFNVNEGNKQKAFDVNTANGLDAYDRLFQGATAAFNPKFDAAKLQFSDLYNRWKAGLDATTNVAIAGAQ